MIDSVAIKKFKSSQTKLVLLDYDGTLVYFERIPSKAVPSDKVIKVLDKHIKQPDTDVSIITGRMHQEIDRFLGYLPLNIIAEHGAFKKEKGKWVKQFNVEGKWKKQVTAIFNNATLECPNSFIEEKHFSIAWHYRNVPEEMGKKFAKKLINSLKEVCELYNLRIINGNKVIEIMNSSIDKGQAISKIVEMKNYDCILCIGDDITDEDMFSYLKDNKKAITIKIGKGKTLANYKLKSVDEVIELLETLS